MFLLGAIRSRISEVLAPLSGTLTTHPHPPVHTRLSLSVRLNNGLFAQIAALGTQIRITLTAVVTEDLSGKMAMVC